MHGASDRRSKWRRALGAFFFFFGKSHPLKIIRLFFCRLPTLIPGTSPKTFLPLCFTPDIKWGGTHKFSSKKFIFIRGKLFDIDICQVNHHLKYTWWLRLAHAMCSSCLWAGKDAISTAKAHQMLQRCSAGSLSCAATVRWAHVIVTSCFVAWVSDLGNTWLAAAAWFRRQLPSHRGVSLEMNEKYVFLPQCRIWSDPRLEVWVKTSEQFYSTLLDLCYTHLRKSPEETFWKREALSKKKKEKVGR